MDCSKLWINRELYYHLQDMADPCSVTNTWIKGNPEPLYKAVITLKDIPNLREFYMIKKQPVNPQSNREKRILRLISDDMLADRAPLLFPFVYIDYVCENDLYFVMQPTEISLQKAVQKDYSVEWWAQVLYQISKAVYYLEEKLINHNNITLDNVTFQNISKDYNGIALMLTDFSSAVQGGNFVVGKDLNYFLYILIYAGVPAGYFPAKLAEQLYPNLRWENLPQKDNENKYEHGLRRATITHNNFKTSGKTFSRWLAEQYPFVTDRCNLDRLNKLYGTGIGAAVGDALGMPIEFDYVNDQIIKKMYPSAVFEGLLSWADLPPGTFTDDTNMALALIDAILSEGRELIPRAVAREFKRWVDSNPPDIGIHTQTVFSAIKKDGSNWEKVSHNVYQENPKSAANGSTMRVWPVAILHHYDDYIRVMDSAIKQSHVSHMNPDAVYASVFVACLVHRLINGSKLVPAINDCLKLVKPFISEELYNAISKGHLKDYEDLEGGKGWIVHTMTVVIWAIRNTKTFSDALIRAANVRGDTDTNASITGAIAGALYGFDAIPEKWLKPFNTKNKWNFWNGQQMTIPALQDRIATLAQC